jgi:glutathione-regulated potassium-efflux system ancillary protein KefC
MALSLAISFVFAAILNANAHTLYANADHYLRRYQTRALRTADQPADLRGAEVLVMGMGRVGSGAFDVMRDVYGDRVCGIDSDTLQVAKHQKEGRNVILGDAEDADFWEGIDAGELRLVMLTMPTLGDMLQTVTRLRAIGYQGPITAVAKHADECTQLEEVGVRAAFNFYAEAGVGFAAHVLQKIPLQGEADGSAMELLEHPVTQGGAINRIESESVGT